MARYKNVKILKNIGEQRKFNTLIIPTFPRTAADTFIRVTSPERLDKLADSFYGDATLWWIIAVTNGLGKGSLHVPANSILRIPANENIQEFINQTNQSR